MANFQLNKRQIAERGIPEKIAEKETLTSLAEIAAYMSCSINKVRDCIQMRGLPAAQIGQSYFTTKENINRWMQEQHIRAIETYAWDKKIHKRKMTIGPERVSTFRGRYGPRPNGDTKKSRINVQRIVHRLIKNI